MAKTLSTVLKLAIAATLAQSGDLATASVPLNFAYDMRMATGTGSDQANDVFMDTRTLVASGTENLDLAGVLADQLGATLTFTKIKAIIVVAADDNTNDVVVGNHATAAFATMFGSATDSIKVKPGGMFAITAPGAGFTVTATTGDMLMVTNGGGTTGVTYDIIIIGTV